MAMLIVGSMVVAHGAVGAPPLPGPNASSAERFEPYVAYATGSFAEAVAVGDVTGDGLNDIALVTSFALDQENDFKLFVFRQLPDGTLAPPIKLATRGSSESVTIGDVNGDARNDVIVGNFATAIGVFYQNASGGLEPVVLHPTPDSRRVRVADLNDDGRFDVVGLGAGTNTVSVLPQQAGGTLASPVVYSVPNSAFEDLEVGDLDHDGLTDVVVLNGFEFAAPQVSVLYQLATGTLGRLASRLMGANHLGGIGVGDVSADGRSDIVVSYGGNLPTSNVALFLQSPDGTLGTTASTIPSFNIPQPVELADIDGDRLDDVLVAHGGWAALGVYQQLPGGGLGPEAQYLLPYASLYNPHGLAVGDINHDGLPDVVIADYNHGLVVLRHVPMAPSPAGYYPVTPCRMLDTRVVSRPLPANTYRTLTAAGSCGVPADALAVAINVTAVDARNLGDFRLYAAGAPVPLSSTINFAPGRPRANNAITTLGPGGRISVRCDMPVDQDPAQGSPASAHLVIDVYGYFR
jgi:FG-GAP-like repeat